VGGKRIGVAVEVGISMVGGSVGGGKGLIKTLGLTKTVAKQAHVLQVRSKTSAVNTSHKAIFFIGCLPIKNRAATFPVVQYIIGNSSLSSEEKLPFDNALVDCTARASWFAKTG